MLVTSPEKNKFYAEQRGNALKCIIDLCYKGNNSYQCFNIILKLLKKLQTNSENNNYASGDNERWWRI